MSLLKASGPDDHWNPAMVISGGRNRGYGPDTRKPGATDPPNQLLHIVDYLSAKKKEKIMGRRGNVYIVLAGGPIT